MNNRPINKPQKLTGRRKAQGMVEFALVLPLLLLIIVGVIEFSRLMYAWIIIENSTRFGIRYATTGNFDTANCADLNNDGKFCNRDNDIEVDAARIPSIKDETRRVIIGFNTIETSASASLSSN